MDATVDYHGLTPADFYLFATMWWLEPTDDGGLELTPGGPSFLDKNGAVIPQHDPRWIFRNRGGTLAIAFYAKLKQDPQFKARFDAVGQRVVEAIPDGADAVFGHKTAFNMLLREGILREIVQKANEAGTSVIAVPDEVLNDPHVWGYEEDSMILSAGAVWDGPKAALPFHCCAGRIRVSPMDVAGDPELALFPKAHQLLLGDDRDYAAKYHEIADPLDREAMSLPHTKEGGARCDAITKALRQKLQSEHLLERVERRARSLIAK
jgi:hypothetical protein